MDERTTDIVLNALPLSGEALDYCCSTETVKNTFVNFGKVVQFHYEGPEIEKRKQIVLTLPRFGRELNIHDDLLPEEERREGGIIILQPGWREQRKDRPPCGVNGKCIGLCGVCHVIREKTEDSPFRKRGRGRPKKVVPLIQFVHMDDKKKKKK